MIFLSAATTAWGLACSFAVEDFKKGAKPDTAVAADGNKIDSSIDSDAVLRDTAIVSDTADTRPRPDTNKPEVDTGPPEPMGACTTVGPSGTICIPTTTFSMGAANATACPPSGCPQEQPKTSVKVSQFHIDEFEVTVKRFRAWWNTMPRPFPAAGATIFSSGAKDLRWKNTWPNAPVEPPATGCAWLGATNPANDDKPINCVEWYTALAFCMSEGKRLPTEAEWELVASAGDDRLFPWSDPGSEDDPFTESDIDCPHALRGTCTPLTTAPNTTIWGRSKFGPWNLSGGFSEWTLDVYTPNYSGIVAGTTDPIADPTTSTSTGRVTRGGSHVVAGTASPLRAAARPSVAVPGTNPDSQIGFRCAKRL